MNVRIGILLVAAGSTLVAGIARADYYSTVTADSPVVYYHLNEAAASTSATDASGGGHTAALNGTNGDLTFGSASLVPSDPGGKSLTLNGTDRLVAPGFDKIGTGYSAEYWIKVTAYPGDCCANIVGDGEAGGDWGMMNYLIGPGQGTNGQIRGHLSPANGAYNPPAGTALALNTVYHVVLTYDGSDTDGGNAAFFINGVEVNRGTVGTAAFTNQDNPLYLGRDDRENRPSNMLLDEVALYDHALTPAQVTAHYLAGVPEPTSLSLVGATGMVLLARRKHA